MDAPEEIFDHGTLVGYRITCMCQEPDDGNPETIELLAIDDPATVACDTAGIVNVVGQPVNTQCLQQTCPVECDYAEDLAITPGLIEVPPGSGIWRDNRWRECVCP